MRTLAQRARLDDRRRAQHTDDRQCEEAAQSKHIAVRKVNEFDDPVDHRVAQRNERDDHAVGEAIDELLKKDLGVRHTITLAHLLDLK